MASTNNLSLKLLVDTKNNKVLFAEAEKEFVDFLFHLMSLPVATIVRLISATDMVGCIGELYASIEALNSNCLLSKATKNSVLSPKHGLTVPLLSLTDSPTKHQSKNFYRCSNHTNTRVCIAFGSQYVSNNINEYVTDAPEQLCPSCNKSMSTKMTYVAPAEIDDVKPSSEGYVKDVITYMVMDHLAVKPMSTISGIAYINEFGVNDIRSLKEKQVQVTMKEGVAILKASLETRDVLTMVFLGKMIED